MKRIKLINKGSIMTVLINQTVYKCSYCGKKNFTKRGSQIHENKYCNQEGSPHMEGIGEIQENCEHNRTELVYRYIPGECVQEPDYDLCLDCGKRL